MDLSVSASCRIHHYWLESGELCCEAEGHRIAMYGRILDSVYEGFEREGKTLQKPLCDPRGKRQIC